MGLAGIGIWQLVVILAIVLLLFGGKRLGSLGSDLGSAITGFRRALREEGPPRQNVGELTKPGDTAERSA
jgi:sec-independent protein translocase protein TatA